MDFFPIRANKWNLQQEVGKSQALSMSCAGARRNCGPEGTVCLLTPRSPPVNPTVAFHSLLSTILREFGVNEIANPAPEDGNSPVALWTHRERKPARALDYWPKWGCVDAVKGEENVNPYRIESGSPDSRLGGIASRSGPRHCRSILHPSSNDGERNTTAKLHSGSP
jgi:hypothetical protein